MAGRPKFNATQAQRRLVRRLARAGIGERDIARRIGVDRKTLRLNLGNEIANYRLQRRLELISALSEKVEFGNVPAINALLKILARSDEPGVTATAKKGAPSCPSSTPGTGEDCRPART
jgi:hypothetical protein